VDLTELNNSQLMLAIGAAAFVAGCVLMRMLHKSGTKSSKQEDPRNHRIRELEADARAVKRQFDGCEDELAATNEEFKTAVATLQHLRTNLAERDTKIEQLEKDLKGSVAKTRELRTELQDRAAEGMREHVRAKQAETELEVNRAGSEAVMSEINRLQEERKHMTSTMKALSKNLMPDDEHSEVDP
jgi:chromosome segregation ATPase